MPLDEFWFDSRSHHIDNSPVVSSIVLEYGVSYDVTVKGNWTVWSSGGNDANYPIMYPSGGTGSYATHDSDTTFGRGDRDGVQGHYTGFVFRTETGEAFFHPEPAGSPHSTPTEGHVYVFTLVGRGQVLRAGIQDTPLSDNNGKKLITIEYATGVDSSLRLRSRDDVNTFGTPRVNVGNTAATSHQFSQRVRLGGSTYS